MGAPVDGGAFVCVTHRVDCPFSYEPSGETSSHRASLKPTRYDASFQKPNQFRQLCDGRRTVYLAFDADSNGSGQQAVQGLACRLREQGLNARRVCLPDGHYPNSFFDQGGDARQFQLLLEEARA